MCLQFFKWWDLHCDRLPCKSSRRKRVSFEAQQSTVYAASLRWGSNRDGFSAQKEFNVASVEGKKPTEVTGKLFPARDQVKRLFWGREVLEFLGNFFPRRSEHLKDKKEMVCEIK